MSREVEYGIRVTAKDELSAPATRASKAASNLAFALDGVEKSAGDAGGALSDQVSPAAKKTASAIEDLTKKLGRLPGLNEKWSASVRGAQDAIQRMIAAGNVGDVGAALGGFDPDAVEEAMRRVGMAHLQAERDRTRATEIEAAKRAAVEQAAMSRVAGLEGPSGPSMMQRALGSISLGGIATGFAAVAASIAAAAFALQRFGAGMLDAARLATIQEQAEVRVLATIRQHTEFSDRQFAALQKRNSERQRALGIGDEEQLQLQGTLAAMGVQAGALNRATEATIGLARATGMGLVEASRAVAKALTGNVGILKEYGITADTVEDAEAKLSDMFRATQAQSGTYGVAVSALSAAWGDLLEAVGQLITKNPQVMQSIQSIIGGIESMTGSMAQGGKTAKGLGTIVTTTFKLIGTSAQVTASLISNMIGALNFVWRSPNLMRLSKDLDKSIVAMQNIMAGGTGREAESAAQQAAEEYLEAFKAAEFYRRELRNIDPAQEGAADAILATNAALAEQEGKLRALQEWASKSTAGTQGMMRAVEDLAQAEADAAQARNQPKMAPKDGTAKPRAAASRGEEMGPTREMFEAYEKEQEAIDKLFAEADAAKARANERAIERERAAAQKIADARAQVEQRALEAERARIAEYAGFWRAALSQVVDLFGNAWGTIGKLQTKTTTEIVRNEKGMLEERTVMTEQYIGTVGTALGQFLGDAASMFAKAALNFIATKAVEAAAGMITSAISTLGLAGLLIAPAAAAVAMGLVAATKSQVPPPPKFFTGGVVPGPMGAPRLAMVEGGERVVSVADSIDQRGSRGGSVVVQQQLLVAPSRVSMERANRDSILPAMRRMQRLGMAT